MSDIVITVRGEHHERVTAERASVQVSASVDGPDRAAVVEQATALAAPLQAEVAAHADAGAVDAWSSDRVSVWADRPWNDRGEQLPLVHHATITVAATFTDATVLSEWLSDLALRDGVQVGGIDWSLSPETRVQIERDVATNAIGEAVRRATAYAQAIGRASVEAIELADVGLLENGTEHASAPRYAKAAMMDAASPGIDLRPGEITVSVAVDARFRAS
ncbi:SIMPL domain-containing protein [Microbacterium dauci]|uniref:SIMPL domain-containing protein n=1 Tax=Microbacterium dauci TaxID=3048008 RepID=A0ABT6ZBM4_9MICO|nr:SIMPL domain-containing protein [Microbacterium sp. LX3-4]MDJ1113555.1 SIMPL domain-containing protein [Microbacterium sp. LX3-4]